MITIKSFDEVDNVTQEMLKTFKKTIDLENVTRLSEISEKLKALRLDEEVATSLRDLNRQLAPFLEAKTKEEEWNEEENPIQEFHPATERDTR